MPRRNPDQAIAAPKNPCCVMGCTEVSCSLRMQLEFMKASNAYDEISPKTGNPIQAARGAAAMKQQSGLGTDIEFDTSSMTGKQYVCSRHLVVALARVFGSGLDAAGQLFLPDLPGKLFDALYQGGYAIGDEHGPIIRAATKSVEVSLRMTPAPENDAPPARASSSVPAELPNRRLRSNGFASPMPTLRVPQFLEGGKPSRHDSPATAAAAAPAADQQILRLPAGLHPDQYRLARRFARALAAIEPDVLFFCYLDTAFVDITNAWHGECQKIWTMPSGQIVRDFFESKPVLFTSAVLEALIGPARMGLGKGHWGRKELELAFRASFPGIPSPYLLQAYRPRMDPPIYPNERSVTMVATALRHARKTEDLELPVVAVLAVEERCLVVVKTEPTQPALASWEGANQRGPPWEAVAFFEQISEDFPCILSVVDLSKPSTPLSNYIGEIKLFFGAQEGENTDQALARQTQEKHRNFCTPELAEGDKVAAVMPLNMRPSLTKADFTIWVQAQVETTADPGSDGALRYNVKECGPGVTTSTARSFVVSGEDSLVAPSKPKKGSRISLVAFEPVLVMRPRSCRFYPAVVISVGSNGRVTIKWLGGDGSEITVAEDKVVRDADGRTAFWDERELGAREFLEQVAITSSRRDAEKAAETQRRTGGLAEGSEGDAIEMGDDADIGLSAISGRKEHDFDHPSDEYAQWEDITDQEYLDRGDRIQVPFPDESGRSRWHEGVITGREDDGEKRWLIGKWNNGSATSIPLDLEEAGGQYDLAFRKNAAYEKETGGAALGSDGAEVTGAVTGISGLRRARVDDADDFDSDGDLDLTAGGGRDSEGGAATSAYRTDRQPHKKRAPSPQYDICSE